MDREMLVPHCALFACFSSLPRARSHHPNLIIQPNTKNPFQYIGIIIVIAYTRPGSKFEKCFLIFRFYVGRMLPIVAARAAGWDGADGSAVWNSSLLCLGMVCDIIIAICAWLSQHGDDKAKFPIASFLPLTTPMSAQFQRGSYSMLFIDVDISLELTGSVNDWWNGVDVKMFM